MCCGRVQRLLHCVAPMGLGRTQQADALDAAACFRCPLPLLSSAVCTLRLSWSAASDAATALQIARRQAHVIPLKHCRPPPEAHRPALDLRGRGDLDELVEATGRPYRTYNYYAPTESPPFDVSEPPLAAAAPRPLMYATQSTASCAGSGSRAWHDGPAAAAPRLRGRTGACTCGCSPHLLLLEAGKALAVPRTTALRPDWQVRQSRVLSAPGGRGRGRGQQPTGLVGALRADPHHRHRLQPLTAAAAAACHGL
jgi:hypothetical protein